MFFPAPKLVLCTVFLLVPTMAVAFDDGLLEEDRKRDFYGRAATGSPDPEDTVVINWPTFHGVQQTGKLAASFNCFGQFGLRYSPFVSDVPGWPNASFVIPADGGAEYLYGGGIWIGGVVGSDTLVSTAIDGVLGRREIYPVGFSAARVLGTVTEFEYVSDHSMRAAFSDILAPGIFYPLDFLGRPHRPLNLLMANRSHIWQTGKRAYLILYDLVITNVGDQEINDGYVGLFFDADIGQTGQLAPHIDDVVGSIRNLGIGYMVDADGDPLGGQLADSVSSTRVFAAGFLKTSFAASDTSFNWWANVTAGGDFGPRRRQDYYEFPSGQIGSPQTDESMYHLLSSGEWDYDQVMTASIGANDPVWMEPPFAAAQDVYNGADTRFLISIGPFDLPPDSSVRVLYTTATADSIIARTDLMQFIELIPEMYDDALNLEFLEEVVSEAPSLVDALLEPENGVVGLHLHYNDSTSAVIEWDPWVFDGVEGYDVHLWPVPPDSLPYPGVVPPWLQPDSLIRVASVDRDRSFTFQELELNQLYLANVVPRTESGPIAQWGQPVMVDLDNRPGLPTPEAPYIFTCTDDPVTLRWTPSTDDNVHRYNVYRFADSAAAARPYHPFYDLGYHKRYYEPVDSFYVDGQWYFYYAMTPVAQLSSDQLSFVDPDWSGRTAYIVSAVNDHGFESGYHQPVIVEPITDRSRDILLVTYSTYSLTSNVYYDSVYSFYSDVLSGYDYDIYLHIDSAAGKDCTIEPFRCIDWHDFMPYKLVIVDDGMSELVLSDFYEDATAGFERYLWSGGKLAYFGSLTGLEHHNADALPRYYEFRHPFGREYFDLDSMFFIGAGWYATYTEAPYIDSLAGFHGALSVHDGAPDVSYGYDTSASPMVGDLRDLWPYHSPPSVAAFKAGTDAEITHVYNSLFSASSMVHSAPVGLHITRDPLEAFLYGFHLWYMDRSDARLLIDWIMSHTPTGAQDGGAESKLPDRVALHQNYPNPFNPFTTIRFDLPRRSEVRLEVFNILGRRVKLLADQSLAAGSHQITWNGDDRAGRKVASGIYFYRLTTDSAVETRKMVLLK